MYIDYTSTGADPHGSDDESYNLLAILENKTPGNDPSDPLVVAKWIWKQIEMFVIIPILCLKCMYSD